MRRLIFNTQGTGISHEQVRRLENTQPGPGAYLEGNMPLGDEIMLLDGLDDTEGLEGLGFVRAGNYRSRGYDMSGFALSASDLSAVPSQRRAGRDFEPWGLGGPASIELRRPSAHPNRARADLRTLRPRSGGGRSHPGGRRGGRDFNPWGLGEQAQVSPYTVDKNSRPDLFIGPRFYPLEAVPRQRRAGRDFEPWGLGEGPVEYSNTPPPEAFFQEFAMGERLESLGGDSYERWADTPPPGTWLDGFGDAAADRRQALQIARSTANIAGAACGLLRGANPAATARDQAACRAGVATALAAAELAINSAIPPGTSGPVTPEQQAVINAKLDNLQRMQEEAEAGRIPTPEDDGMSTTTMLMIGGGVLAVGLLAIVALKR
jgi:hypothetical protein